MSNDPSGDLDPALTKSINETGRIRVVTAAKRAGVRKYLFASSCAVYGAGQDMFLAENAPLRPLTVYAQTCARAEEAVLALNDRHFATTALRNATVFGLSPRMRFDLVVNQMTLDATNHRRISIGGDGSQWRPFVHVRDVAKVVLGLLRAPRPDVAGEVFNVGWDNRQILDVALAIKDRFAGNAQSSSSIPGTTSGTITSTFRRSGTSCTAAPRRPSSTGSPRSRRRSAAVGWSRRRPATPSSGTRG
ncbi:SDR family oxidoreductase [Methylorubrum suomiense]